MILPTCFPTSTECVFLLQVRNKQQQQKTKRDQEMLHIHKQTLCSCDLICTYNTVQKTYKPSLFIEFSLLTQQFKF